MKGRKAVITQKLVEKLVENVKWVSIEQASKSVGYSEDTISKWRRRGAEVNAMLEKGSLLVKDLSKHDALCRELHDGVLEAVAFAELDNSRAILKAGEEDWKARAWWQERRFGSRWGAKQALEHSGPNGGPIELQEIRVLMEQDRSHADTVADADGGGTLDDDGDE